MDRYDPYTDKFLRDTQYDILSTNLAEVGTEERAEERTETHACDCISRQAAVDAFEDTTFTKNEIRRRLSEVPPAQPEKLTDIEQRIFLAAMSKEEKVCREVDKELSDAECINLMRVCKSIERKVKGALWT